MALISNGDQVLTKNVYNSDETVLWEGSLATGITLSESVNNFERVKIFANQRDEQNRITSVEILTDVTGTVTHQFPIVHIFSNGTNTYNFWGEYLIDNTGKTITLNYGGYLRWQQQNNLQQQPVSFTASNPFNIVKVIGINRKEGV